MSCWLTYDYHSEHFEDAPTSVRRLIWIVKDFLQEHCAKGRFALICRGKLICCIKDDEDTRFISDHDTKEFEGSTVEIVDEADLCAPCLKQGIPCGGRIYFGKEPLCPSCRDKAWEGIARYMRTRM